MKKNPQEFANAMSFQLKANLKVISKYNWPIFSQVSIGKVWNRIWCKDLRQDFGKKIKDLT
jgi:hypothetical protein